jgi:protein-tyrosine phosphatase
MNMSLTELPLGLPGRIFRSPVPYGDFDPEGRALEAFKEHHISVVVLLAEEQEISKRTGRDLKTLYLTGGLEVIHLPIPDFDVPEKEELEKVLDLTLSHAKAGRNIVIHCHAGISRTGLLVAYLARRVLSLPGAEAIR